MSATLTILGTSHHQLKLVEGEFSATGILYYQLVTDSFEETKKMILAN